MIFYTPMCQHEPISNDIVFTLHQLAGQYYKKRHSLARRKIYIYKSVKVRIKIIMRVSNTEATAWLLLLLSTTATTVESFIPTHQFNSLQLRQQQQSLIINYDNIPGQHDGENNEGEREHTKNNKRFGANIMEVITGQLYATKVRRLQTVISQIGGRVGGGCRRVPCYMLFQHPGLPKL